MQLSKLVSEADRNDMQIMKKILMAKASIITSINNYTLITGVN